jgi:glycogen debranching enzyme
MNDNYFLETSNHEWLLTNKTGGYALGTGNLINQRKYHGLLISSDRNLNRYHLLAGLEIMLEWYGETCFLDSTNYSSCIYPEGFLHLVKSWLRPYPVFLYSALHHNNDILVKKEIMMADNENTVLVKISNLGTHPLNFSLRPKLTMRNHHHTNPPGFWEGNPEELQIAGQSFLLKKDALSLCGLISRGEIIADRIVYRDCYYPWEAIRGYHGVEDQLAPVRIFFSLQPGETENLIFSDSSELPEISALSKKIAGIERKYKKLPLPQDYPRTGVKKGITAHESLLSGLDYDDGIMFEHQDYLKILEFSLHDFLLQDDVIAGYPWFGSWGRDTFIYFDALLRSNISLRHCRKIISKYARLIEKGLIPNMLSESGIGLNYHSIDSTLWFALAIYNLVNKAVAEELHGKKSLIKEALLHLELIIREFTDRYEQGEERENNGDHFYLAENGLLYLTDEFASATWMDARIADKPATPRSGAPVEINGLLYNALCCYRELREMYSPESSGTRDILPRVNLLIDRIKASFSLFWLDGYLADRLDGDKPVREHRPNGLIAVSLPFSPLDDDRICQVFEAATRELLTPYGLRSLSPADYRFKRKYLGNQKERDAQYHQGTVWAWLLDPYIKTFSRTCGKTKSPFEQVSEILKIIDNLRTGYMKGHIASVAEVWDGDKPHFPKGCPAQAWSVAALYNAEKLIEQLITSGAKE